MYNPPLYREGRMPGDPSGMRFSGGAIMPGWIPEFLKDVKVVVTIIVSSITAFVSGGVVANVLDVEASIYQRFPGSRYIWSNQVSDASEVITVRVPAEWKHTTVEDERLVLDDRDYAPALFVSASDPVKWWTGYETSGLYLAASESLANMDFEEILPMVTNADTACDNPLVTQSLRLRDNRDYTAQYKVWTGCGKDDGTFLAFVAWPEDKQYAVVGLLTIANESDWKARRMIFDSFEVDPKKLSAWEP